MNNSTEILEILDSYLTEKKISRRQFALSADIPTSTLSNLKNKDMSPSVELIAKIAKFMNVTVEWLIYGDDSNNTFENKCSRKNIVYRIENRLKEITGEFKDDFESLYNKYLSDIIAFNTLKDWETGKIFLNEDVLPKIAERLNNTSLNWLLKGEEKELDIRVINNYDGKDSKEKKLPPLSSDIFLYSLAKKYPDLLKNYNCLDAETQKAIDILLQKCRDSKNATE